ncbi:hypothetical protein [Kitasatospora sp. NBC_01302]|nr:hypothetical protein OG294_39355 [Kitasatospora sp. NBC_01302]
MASASPTAATAPHAAVTAHTPATSQEQLFGCRTLVDAWKPLGT